MATAGTTVALRLTSSCRDRKSTRLNSSHVRTSYAVFCLKKKKASRALARVARSADDYAQVYGQILRQVREPVIVHWLGDMFDPQLRGYWGSFDLDVAMANAVAIINDNAGKIDGVKISLLDKDKEIAMRRRLPPGIRMYTGDDFNYAELIEGDREGYSDALLGIFDVIAPAASAALVKLAANDREGFHTILAP